MRLRPAHAVALLLWSGWSASLWARPEHVSLVLLGIVAPRLLVAPAGIVSLGLASSVTNELAVARWWPTPEQRAAYTVLAQVPPTASIAAQDRYVGHLSERRLATYFPTAVERAYVLVNLDTYPWRDLPEVKLERTGNAVTLVISSGRVLRYAVVAQSGPHSLGGSDRGSEPTG